MGKKGTFRIGEVAKQSKTSVDTIRYYEKLRLIEEPLRTEGGFRQYTHETIEKLRFIRKAKNLGFSLREIHGIIRGSQQGLKPCCQRVRELVQDKISEFEGKIKELERMKGDLESLLSEWISPQEAKKKTYAVCPQIERESKDKTRERRKIPWKPSKK